MRAHVSPQRVCAVEITAERIEPKKSDTQRFRTVLRVGKHSPRHENQASTSVARTEARCALHQFCA